jgi:hypothetical protein
MAYLTGIQPRIAAASQGLESISEQSDLASQDPLLMKDPDWMSTTALALATMQAAGSGLQAHRAVPPDFVKFDALLVRAGSELVMTATHYAKGVDDVNAAELNVAVTHMQAGNADIQQAASELQTIELRYGVTP